MAEASGETVSGLVVGAVRATGLIQGRDGGQHRLEMFGKVQGLFCEELQPRQAANVTHVNRKSKK